MNTSRIPNYDCKNPDGMLIWFSEMANQNLLFHPEDSPETIINLTNEQPLFTSSECAEISMILTDMFAKHGDEVIEACYPIFMRKSGQISALN